MRTAFGLLLIGTGGLLVYAGFSGDSVKRMLTSVIGTGTLEAGRAGSELPAPPSSGVGSMGGGTSGGSW